MLPNRFALSCSLMISITLTVGCSRKVAEPSAAELADQQKPSRRVTLKEVQPIFSRNCIACHNPSGMDTGVPLGNLILLEGQAADGLINVHSIESPLVRVFPGS